MQFRKWILENVSPLEQLVQQIEAQYPNLELDVSERVNKISIDRIYLPPEERGDQIGSDVIRMIQKYAQSVSLPVVLTVEAEPRYKAKLQRFYRDLDFVPNKGRNKDYSLSSPFGPTMVWRP